MIPFHSLSPAILRLLFCTDARHRLISHAQTHATMSRGECLHQQKFCSGATIKACGETDEPGAPPPPPAQSMQLLLLAGSKQHGWRR